MKFLCIVLMVIFSGCKVTGSVGVEKDWITESGRHTYNYHGPDLRVVAKVNFTNQ